MPDLMPLVLAVISGILSLVYQVITGLYRFLDGFLLPSELYAADSVTEASDPSSSSTSESDDDEYKLGGIRKRRRSKETKKGTESREAFDPTYLSEGDINKWRREASRKARQSKVSFRDDPVQLKTTSSGSSYTKPNQHSRTINNKRSRPAHPVIPIPTLGRAILQRDFPKRELPKSDPSDPKFRYMNSRKAYIWFRTVYRNVVECGRTDLLLNQGGLPHEYAFILYQGWISLNEAIAWADARYTIGQGLLDLVEQKKRGEIWKQSEYDVRMSDSELEEFTESWVTLKRASSELRPYSWPQDRADRKRYGPFGSKLTSFAKPENLERILTWFMNDELDLEATRLSERLKAIFGLLIKSKEIVREQANENDNDNVADAQTFNQEETAAAPDHNMAEGHREDVEGERSPQADKEPEAATEPDCVSHVVEPTQQAECELPELPENNSRGLDSQHETKEPEATRETGDTSLSSGSQDSKAPEAAREEREDTPSDEHCQATTVQQEREEAVDVVPEEEPDKATNDLVIVLENVGSGAEEVPEGEESDSDDDLEDVTVPSKAAEGTIQEADSNGDTHNLTEDNVVQDGALPELTEQSEVRSPGKAEGTQEQQPCVESDSNASSQGTKPTDSDFGDDDELPNGLTEEEKAFFGAIMAESLERQADQAEDSDQESGQAEHETNDSPQPDGNDKQTQPESDCVVPDIPVQVQASESQPKVKEEDRSRDLNKFAGELEEQVDYEPESPEGGCVEQNIPADIQSQPPVPESIVKEDDKSHDTPTVVQAQTVETVSNNDLDKFAEDLEAQLDHEPESGNGDSMARNVPVEIQTHTPVPEPNIKEDDKSHDKPMVVQAQTIETVPDNDLDKFAEDLEAQLDHEPEAGNDDHLVPDIPVEIQTQAPVPEPTVKSDDVNPDKPMPGQANTSTDNDLDKFADKLEAQLDQELKPGSGDGEIQDIPVQVRTQVIETVTDSNNGSGDGVVQDVPTQALSIPEPKVDDETIVNQGAENRKMTESELDRLVEALNANLVLEHKPESGSSTGVTHDNPVQEQNQALAPYILFGNDANNNNPIPVQASEMMAVDDVFAASELEATTKFVQEYNAKHGITTIGDNDVTKDIPVEIQAFVSELNGKDDNGNHDEEMQHQQFIETLPDPEKYNKHFVGLEAQNGYQPESGASDSMMQDVQTHLYHGIQPYYMTQEYPVHVPASMSMLNITGDALNYFQPAESFNYSATDVGMFDAMLRDLNTVPDEACMQAFASQPDTWNYMPPVVAPTREEEMLDAPAFLTQPTPLTQFGCFPQSVPVPMQGVAPIPTNTSFFQSQVQEIPEIDLVSAPSDTPVPFSTQAPPAANAIHQRPMIGLPKRQTVFAANSLFPLGATWPPASAGFAPPPFAMPSLSANMPMPPSMDASTWQWQAPFSNEPMSSSLDPSQFPYGPSASSAAGPSGSVAVPDINGDIIPDYRSGDDKENCVPSSIPPNAAPCAEESVVDSSSAAQTSDAPRYQKAQETPINPVQALASRLRPLSSSPFWFISHIAAFFTYFIFVIVMFSYLLCILCTLFSDALYVVQNEYRD